MNPGLISLIVLVILSGLFSAAEIALTSLSAAKVRSIADDKRFGSKAIMAVKEKPQRLLISILVGNQAVNIVATVVATIWAISVFGEDKISLATLIFTIVLILFGSLLPKTLALRYNEIIARALSYPLLGFIMLARPVVWIFELIVKGILKLIGADSSLMERTSEQEIEAMLDLGEESGALAEDQKAYLKQVLKFTTTKVEDIMTLLKDIKAIPLSMTKKELREYLIANDHARFPVYDEDLNDIKGIISWHGILGILQKSRKKAPLEDFAFKKLVVIPKTTSITELLKELKDKQDEMCLVVDEHGQTIGIATLEDILEEMAGARLSHQESRPPETTVIKKGKNLWLAKGETTIGELNKALNAKLPFPEHQVLSLVILETLKRFPEAGERIALDGISAEIKSMDKRSIKSIEVRKSRSKEK